MDLDLKNIENSGKESCRLHESSPRPGLQDLFELGTVPYRNHDFYEELSVCVKETDTNGAGKSK